MTYYEVLQVSERAPAIIIEAAWKALMLEHHPDKGGEPEIAARINEAHDVLSDPERRTQYDAQLLAARIPRSVPIQPQERAYPDAYVHAYPDIDFEQMARDTAIAGAKAATEHVFNEIAKNPFFKSVLDNLQKKRKKSG
jgi:curved DNA-binding protein CbpA